MHGVLMAVPKMWYMPEQLYELLGICEQGFVSPTIIFFIYIVCYNYGIEPLARGGSRIFCLGGPLCWG